MAKIGVIKGQVYSNLIADKCPQCQQMAEIRLSIYQSSFIVGLPLFPTGKSEEIKCTSCNKNISLTNAPHYVAGIYNNQMATIKTPKWSYSGAVILGVIMVVAAIYAPYSNSKLTGYINNPHIGDVYEIKYEDESAIFRKDRYSLLKLVDTAVNELTFSKCMYEASGISKLSEMKRKPEDELWADEEVTYSKAALIEQLDVMAKIHISDIDRKD
jgi:phage FluMu protein Com